MSNIVSCYTLEQAIADGVLAPVFTNRWDELSGEKAIVATAAIIHDLSLAAIQEIWNEYVIWRQRVMPTLPEEEQLFKTRMNGQTVWVLEDGDAFTVLYPDDY